MYQALYRKYRPKNFDDVVGQEVIIKTLTNAVKNNMVSHAYLFTGPRGTGKTSIAKIYAKILNCEHLDGLKPCEQCISCTQINNNQNIDVIEIDAASNSGVGEIREIRNKVSLVPSNSKYKIYIIDEVHMLTPEAFNALLKTLEEPPSHIIFIFATTELQKIPSTILSRCQKFDFKKISNKHIVERLKYISQVENIQIQEDALEEIAILADGGLRDSVSMLDQALSYSGGEITLKDIHDINGTVEKKEIRTLIQNIIQKEIVAVLEKVESYEEQGKNLVKIVQEMIEELKNIILYWNAPEFFIEKDSYYDDIKNLSTNRELYDYIHALSELMKSMQNSNNNKILLEIEFIKLMGNNYQEEVNDKTNKIVVEMLKSNVSEEKEKKMKTEKQEEVNLVLPKDVELKTTEEPKKEDSINRKKELDLTNTLSEEAVKELSELKRIRINNSLVSVSQKVRNQFKEKLEILKELLLDPDYSKLVSLLLDGELKVISDKNMIFVYKTSLMADAFNLELLALEKLFKEKLEDDYRLIAVDEQEWNTIKTEYNKNKKAYHYQEETIDIHKIFEKENTNVKKTNIIDELFDSIVEYE